MFHHAILGQSDAQGLFCAGKRAFLILSRDLDPRRCGIDDVQLEGGHCGPSQKASNKIFGPAFFATQAKTFRPSMNT